MRLYQDCLEMIKEVQRDLKEMGIFYQSETVQDKFVGKDKNFETLELVGYAYTLTSYKNLEEMLNFSGKINREWIDREIEDRLNLSLVNKNPGHAWKCNADLWEKFIRDGKFSYSYSERWQEQIPYVINELRLRKNSRQAMITMYDRHQDMLNWGGKDRVPCSVSYQFLIRENKLVCIYNQRSCDFQNFFAADVYFTIKLQEFIARQVKIESGDFIHFLGSLHAFRKDLKEVF